MLVIWTTQRSGSTWLCQMLNQHSSFRCFGEVYHPDPVACNVTGPSELLPDMRFCEFEGTHGQYHQHLAKLAGGPYGIKVMYNVASLRMLAALRGEARFVHLLRDPLDSCLSQEVLDHTEIAHSEEEFAIAPFAVDVARFKRRLRKAQRRQRRAKLIARGYPAIEVRYENLSEDPQKELNRIFAFLGLPAETLGVGSIKKIRADYRGVIENYSDLISGAD